MMDTWGGMESLNEIMTRTLRFVPTYLRPLFRTPESASLMESWSSSSIRGRTLFMKLTSKDANAIWRNSDEYLHHNRCTAKGFRPLCLTLIKNIIPPNYCWLRWESKTRNMIEQLLWRRVLENKFYTLVVQCQFQPTLMINLTHSSAEVAITLAELGRSANRWGIMAIAKGATTCPSMTHT